MKLVVISHKRTGKVVAVVENPNFGTMTKGAVVLAWALSQGYAKIPTDVEAEEINMTPFANIMLSLIPTHIGDQIKSGQYED